MNVVNKGHMHPDPLLEQEAQDEGELRCFRTPEDGHGSRLDRVLAQLLPEFSRSYLSQLIQAGEATVDGRVVTKPATRLRSGQELGICLRPTALSQAFVPQPMELDVVHEDEHLLVVNKPAGLVVHPAPGHWGGTLLNGLLARDRQAAQLPRAGIVHRLDKDTSGLLVVARSRLGMDALTRQLADRSMRREYLALAHGHWDGAAQRRIEAAIGRDRRNRLRMAVVGQGASHGKPARTDVQLLQNAARGCLLRCRLHSGRTHQIRVHLAFCRHPLVGDHVYGGADAAGLVRQGLHAWRLGFQHPADGHVLEFVQPPPADLAAALAAWQLTIPDDLPA